MEGPKSSPIPELFILPSLLSCSGPRLGPAAGDGSASPRAVSSITVHHGGAAADLDDIFA